MVKKGICFDGCTEQHGINGGFLFAIRSQDYIVEPIVRPSDGAFGDKICLMHDNACPMLLAWCRGIQRRPESR